MKVHRQGHNTVSLCLCQALFNMRLTVYSSYQISALSSSGFCPPPPFVFFGSPSLLSFLITKTNKTTVGKKLVILLKPCCRMIF